MYIDYMIIYIHGFGSTGNATKANILKKHFDDVVSPDLPGSPTEAIKLINGLIDKRTDDNVMLVASSLGGFYALNVLKRKGVKVFLINPSLNPLTNLKGKVTDRFADELKEAELDEFPRRLGYVYTLLAKNDDVIPYENAAERLKGSRKLIIVDDGGHRMTNFEDYIPEIKKLHDL